MKQEEHDSFFQRWKKNRNVLIMAVGEHTTASDVMERLQMMGVVRKAHRDRRWISLESAILIGVALAVAAMIGFGIYIFAEFP